MGQHGEDELPCIDAVANLELWSVGVSQSLQTDRSSALLVCGCHRFAFSKSAVKADREVSGRLFADWATHSNHTINASDQRFCLDFAIARVEYHNLDRCTYCIEHVLQRLRRHQLRTAIYPLE